MWKQISLVNIFDGYECFDTAVLVENAGKTGVAKIETVFAWFLKETRQKNNLI